MARDAGDQMTIDRLEMQLKNAQGTIDLRGSMLFQAEGTIDRLRAVNADLLAALKAIRLVIALRNIGPDEVRIIYKTADDALNKVEGNE